MHILTTLLKSKILILMILHWKKNQILYKTFISVKPLCIMLDEVDRLIIDYNGSNYLLLFDSEKYNAIFNRIRYFIRLKSSISYVISQNYPKITVDSDDDLPLEKTKTA